MSEENVGALCQQIENCQKSIDAVAATLRDLNTKIDALDQKYVSKELFNARLAPLEKLVYGLVAISLGAIGYGLLSLLGLKH